MASLLAYLFPSDTYNLHDVFEHPSEPISISIFAFEITAIVSLILILSYYFYGVSANRSKAIAWLNTNRCFFDDNFSQVGVNGKMLVKDGPKRFILFASGRDGVQSLYLTILLKGRHDVVMIVYNWFMGIEEDEEIVLVFNLGYRSQFRGGEGRYGDIAAG